MSEERVNDIEIFLPSDDFKSLLERLGFYVHPTGIIMNKKTQQPVESITGKEVNFKTDRGLALIVGASCKFIKDVAELSHFIAQKEIKNKQ